MEGVEYVSLFNSELQTNIFITHFLPLLYLDVNNTYSVYHMKAKLQQRLPLITIKMDLFYYVNHGKL